MWIQLASGIAVGALFGRTPTQSAIITGATIGTSTVIRRLGVMRVAQAGWFGIRALGAMTIQGFAAAVVGGALVGTGVSYLLFGKEGAKAAVDFYTDPFDVEKGKTILKAPGRVAARIQANRAVANNAAGLPTGQSIYGSHLTRTAAGAGIPINEYRSYGHALREYELGYTNVDPRI